MLIVLNVVFSQETVDFDLKSQWKITENLYNPVYLKTNKEFLYVVDFGANQPFIRINTITKETEFFGKWGMGPSEVSKRGGVNICGFDKNHIYVADKGQKKIIVFNQADLSFNSVIDISKIFALNIIYDPAQKRFVINEANLKPYFFTELIFDSSKKIKKYTLKKGKKFGDFHSLEPLGVCTKNYLLKQGYADVDNDGNIYFVTANGSCSMGFGKSNKNIFITLKPYDIEIPNFVSFPGMGSGFMSPPINFYPETYVGIDVDAKYVYGIYSGYKDDSKSSQFETVQLGHGKKLIVFNKYTGVVYKIVNLPYRINAIQVSDNGLYFMTADEEIAIVKYDIKSFQNVIK